MKRKEPEQIKIKVYLKADVKTLEAFRDDCKTQSEIPGLVNGKDLRSIYAKLATRITHQLEDL